MTSTNEPIRPKIFFPGDFFSSFLSFQRSYSWVSSETIFHCQKKSVKGEKEDRTHLVDRVEGPNASCQRRIEREEADGEHHDEALVVRVEHLQRKRVRECGIRREW